MMRHRRPDCFLSNGLTPDGGPTTDVRRPSLNTCGDLTCFLIGVLSDGTVQIKAEYGGEYAGSVVEFDDAKWREILLDIYQMDEELD
jgi:hypothetical protein